jgi:hypothetical protein
MTELARRFSANVRQVYDLALAGVLGAVLGLYLYTELAYLSPELAQSDARWWARDLLAGVALGSVIGFCLNASGPLRDGAWLKLMRAATWGALAGAAGGALGLILGEYVLGGLRGGLLGRSLSWAILGLGIGLSQGVADRSRQRLVFGLIGGGLGGLVGGFLFEWFREGPSSGYDPSTSQGLGIVILGAGLGAGLALVEQALRRAWVQVLQGRQEGRTYLLAVARARLGLDEHAEVGLFGDREIARRHAEIEAAPGGRYVLHNLDEKGRTRLNGRPVTGAVTLNDGDRIELGRTLLVFRQRGSTRTAS